MGDMSLMPKICENRHFLVIFKNVFWDFGAQIGPHILLQTPYELLFYLWDIPQCMYQKKDKFD